MTIDVEANLKARLVQLFKSSPHIQALLEIQAVPLQDSLDACYYLLTHNSIDTAEGALLDIKGELIGVKRPRAQETRLFKIRKRGEAYDLDNDHGLAEETDATVTTGGYLVTRSGLGDVLNPDSMMSDADYRYLIRQKSYTYRKKAKLENLFNYLLAFGARCTIDDEETFKVVFDPIEYNDFTRWQINYISTKGFKPAGIKVRVRDMMRDEELI